MGLTAAMLSKTQAGRGGGMKQDPGGKGGGGFKARPWREGRGGGGLSVTKMMRVIKYRYLNVTLPTDVFA
jgi:hypothetical protein